MNVLYNSALRQGRGIRSDLERLNESLDKQTPITAAEIGNVSASLAAFTKTIDEYNSLVRQELVAKKQEEGKERVKKFRAELADLRSQITNLKTAREEAMHSNHRNELLGRKPYQSSGPAENPYTMNQSPSSASGPGRGHANPNSNPNPYENRYSSTALGSGDSSREAHAFREQSFVAQTHSALDDYIARGQAVLGDLQAQREMMKNTQKRLYSVANTLGISGDTIRMVERRAREDRWIFAVGAVVFFLFCWMCIHFLR